MNCFVVVALLLNSALLAGMVYAQSRSDPRTYGMGSYMPPPPPPGMDGQSYLQGPPMRGRDSGDRQGPPNRRDRNGSSNRHDHDHSHHDHDHNSSSSNSSTNDVRIEERDGYRYIYANGIPDHQTGQFPGRGNPHSISAQSYQFRVTMNPKDTGQFRESGGLLFGVALNGVVFDPGTAEYYNNDRSSGWRVAAIAGASLGIDMNHAHVQPSGAYHYHGLPTGLINKQAKGKKKMTLIGYAADGFPIYNNYGYTDPDNASSSLKKLTSSYRVRKGTRPSGNNSPGGRYDGTYDQDWEYVEDAGDLDEANGRTGVTPEYPNGTYYYVVTDSYPYVSRYFRGTPDSSFGKRQGGGMERGGPGGAGGARDSDGRHQRGPRPRGMHGPMGGGFDQGFDGRGQGPMRFDEDMPMPPPPPTSGFGLPPMDFMPHEH